MGGLEFAHPKVLLGLVIPLTLFWLFSRNSKEFSSLRALLGSSWTPPDPWALKVRRIAPFLTVVFLLLALAGPRGNPHYSPETEARFRKMKTLVNVSDWNIILDTSASMTATDTPSQKSRLEGAQEIADLLIKNSAFSGVALFALGSDLVKVAPRTQDKFFARFLVKQMEVNEGGEGTDFLTAFKRLGEELKEKPTPQKIILLTDGDDTLAESLKEPARVERREAIFKALKPEEGQSLPIYIVAFGSPEGAPVPGVLYRNAEVISKMDKPLLEYLGDKSGGALYSYNQKDPLALVSELQAALAASKSAQEEQELSAAEEALIWDEYFQIPLALALVSLILFLTWPDTLPKGGFKPLSQGLLALALLPGSSLDRKVEIYLEAGNGEKVEELLLEESTSPTSLRSPWEEGALVYNRALLELEKGETVKADEILRDHPLSASSSAWVKARWSLLEALLWMKVAERENYPLLLWPALYSLEEAKKASCEFEREKGYKDCLPVYRIEELKKRILETVKDESLISEKLSELRHRQELKRQDYLQRSPSEVLENGIDEALATYLDKQMVKLSGNRPEDRVSPISPALQAVSSFIPVSYAWSEKRFLKEGCDSSAWPQIVSLFEQGLKEIQKGEELPAVKHWREAIKLLSAPSSQNRPQESPSESVSALQSMELEDRQLAPAEAPVKKVEKPW